MSMENVKDVESPSRIPLEGTLDVITYIGARGHGTAENALIIVSGNVYEEVLATGVGVVENGSRYIKHLLTNAKVRSIKKRNDAPLF